MEQHTIKIYRSRKHLTLLIVGGIGFVALGTFMFTRPDASPVIHTIALVTILFFGVCALAGGYFFFRRKADPVVVLSPEKLLIHNGDGSCYEVPWQQITGFEAIEWLGEVVIAIRITDTERTIEAEENILYRKSLQFNYKQFETPYCVIPSALDYPKGKLIQALRHYRTRYGNPGR